MMPYAPTQPARGLARTRVSPPAIATLAYAAVVAGAVISSGPARAAEWTGTVSNSWFVGGNWNPAGVPTGSAVGINTQSPNPARLAGAAASAFTLTVGDTGNGSLAIADGGILSQFGLGTLGQSVSRTGVVTVDGANSAWNITSNNLYVGNNGSGSLTLTGGATVTNGFGIIGRLAGSSGTVSVSGSGSTWASRNTVTVGAGGSGSLSVLDGGVVTSIGPSAAVGSSATGSATVSGPGSRWSHTGYMFVGQSAAGSLTLDDGARVGVTQYLHVGVNPGGDGEITVDGDGSRLDVGSRLLLGQTQFGPSDGDGQLTITDGALVTVGTLFGLDTRGGSALRLDGGFLAWQGDRVADLQSLRSAGGIELLDDGGWTNAAGSPRINLDYFAPGEAAAAAAFTGNRYTDLDGYTLLTAAAFAVSLGLPGDYNDSGSVEQGDLDLVLNNWGSHRTAGFVANADGFATANVDQEELDAVLNNWGGSLVPNFQGVVVPEPATSLLLLGAFACLYRRRTVAA